MAIGDEANRAEVDGREMVEAIRVGEPLDVGSPPGGGHRDAQMIEHGPAADEGLSPRLVG
jgi:hypothetical protein